MFDYKWLNNLTKAQRTTSFIPKERVRRYAPKTVIDKPLTKKRKRKEIKLRKVTTNKNQNKREEANRQYALLWKTYQKST